jgi:putative molybdopterin biosynthesis protein
MTDFVQQQFLTVIDRDEAERRFRAVLDLSALEAESVPLSEALTRVLAEDVIAPLDVPAFDRSNVDGFAVQSTDTFGASEDQPLSLTLNSESLSPGTFPKLSVRQGTATAIATGAMLPRGADAVVMIEHTDIRENGMLRLVRPVAPAANISFAGTDIGCGEMVLRRGEMLTSRETGVLAALGLDRVRVVRRPRVAIVSTGDELLAPGVTMRPGCVHDSNSTVLADAVRELGGEPVALGIVPDDEAQLTAVLERALEYDVILLSGGTSKGNGDISYRVVGKLGSPGIVAHGVALKPGKPLCLAAVKLPERRAVPIAVLPGFPTSAIFTFHEFLAGVIRRLAGRIEQSRETVQAQLPLRVNSERGRTEYLLVSLVANMRENQPRWLAYPMGKGSGSVTSFSRADGFIVIPRQREYVESESVVEVQLLARDLRPADLVVIGSHCTGLDYLLGRLAEMGYSSKTLAVGSTAGLEAAKRGECDLAGIHLLDPKTKRYNVPFLSEGIELQAGYHRRQGIVFRKGDARFENRTAKEALRIALSDPECVLVNRNRGSGTRILIDDLLTNADKPAGYLTEAKSHNAVVAAIAQGRADWGVAIEPVVGTMPDLGFVPLCDEQYDFVVPKSRNNRPAVLALRALLSDAQVRAELERRGFRQHPSSRDEATW